LTEEVYPACKNSASANPNRPNLE